MIDRIKQELKELISMDDINAFFSIIDVKIVQTSKINNEFILLKSRFTKLRKDKNQNTISIESINIEINKIRAALLTLIEELQIDDLVNSIIPYNDNTGFISNLEENEESKFLRLLEIHGKRRKLRLCFEIF